MPTIITAGAASANGFGFAGGSPLAAKQVFLTTTNTLLTWVVPTDWNNINATVEVIGAGGGGGSGDSKNQIGGGGAAVLIQKLETLISRSATHIVIKLGQQVQVRQRNQTHQLTERLVAILGLVPRLMAQHRLLQRVAALVKVITKAVAAGQADRLRLALEM
jgi:hypothetical protein